MFSVTIKKTFKFRIAVLIIAALGVLPILLSGCKKTEQAVKTKLDHVYKSEFINLPEEIQNFERFFYSNGKLYFTSYTYSEENSKNTLYSMNPDGTELKEVMSFDSNNSYVTALTMLPDGGMWVVRNTPATDEKTQEYRENYSMIKYSADGTEQLNVSLNEIFSDKEYFYIYSLTCDKEGNLYTVMEDTVYMLDAEGKLLNKAKIENGYINNIAVDASGNVYVLMNEQQTGKMSVKTLDPKTGNFGEDISFGAAANYAYNLIPGSAESEYDFYYNNSVSLCGLKIATGESTELCNWINSDINSNNLGNITVLSEDKILCTTYDELDSKQKLILLTSVPEDQIVEKYVLTLAASYVDYNIRSAIIAFNRTNEEYRIDVRDYSIYNTNEDYTQAVTMLNNDIVAGNIPDIIQLNSEMPIDSYISKGLFADLNEYIANDTEIKREDYLANIFDALSVNGKLYEIIPSFSVQTVAGKKSVVGGAPGWTMDEFNAVLEKYPDSAAFFDLTQADMLRYICTITAGQFINKDTGLCSFDSDGFIKLLEFTKKLSEKSIWESSDRGDWDEDFWRDMETAYRDGRVLLQVQWLDSFRSYWQIMKGTFGEDINLIGFPTDNRNGSAINPTFELAMSAKTKMPEGAWQFLRYFLTDEYQDKINYNFPIKISRLDEMAKEAMEPYKWTDPTTGEVHEYPTTIWDGQQSVEIGEITQEYVDIVMNFLKSLNQVVRYDNSMLDIINEETAAFFAGSKSAAETAKIIQNRVSIYVSESR